MTSKPERIRRRILRNIDILSRYTDETISFQIGDVSWDISCGPKITIGNRVGFWQGLWYLIRGRTRRSEGK